MKNITLKVVSRSALVVALSVGATASVVSVASASSRGHHETHHHGVGRHEMRLRVEGVVTGYSSGSSITVQSRRWGTPVTYTITGTTTTTGLATGASLVVGDRVNLVLSSTTSGDVVSIAVQVPDAVEVHGVVTAYTPSGSIAIQGAGTTTSITYALATGVTITGLPTGVDVAVGDQVSLQLSNTTPVTVTAIDVDANA